MPKQASERFICRECHKRRDRATESSPREARLCVHCFKKLNPQESAAITVKQSDSSTATFSEGPVPSTLIGPLGTLVPDRREKPKSPPLPFEDAEILAACESPEFQLELSLKNRIILKYKADNAKLRIDALNESLLAFYKRNGIHAVVYDSHPVSIMYGSRPTIKAELLLAAGVPADVIERCTTRTEFETISVREPKRDKAEEAAS